LIDATGYFFGVCGLFAVFFSLSWVPAIIGMMIFLRLS
jgi:hypothetical protein